MDPSPLEKEFVAFAGQMAESLSLNRSLGQIYGLLYLRPEPLSLDEIARGLAMSKGNASVNVRALESWGAVRPVSVRGSRRDHYEAERGLQGLLARRVREGLAKRLDAAEARVKKLAAYEGAPPRVGELMSFLTKSRRALKVLSTMSGLV